jgi:hypothetical protein
MKLFVYYNLHKLRWSMRDCKTRLVVGHTDLLTLLDVRFKVSAAGRARVLKERKKNVHAGCEGMLAGKSDRPAGEYVQVKYNPYLYSSFVLCSDDTPVEGAEAVTMLSGKVFALNPY